MRPTSASNQIPALKWTIKILQIFGAYNTQSKLLGFITIASLSFLSVEIAIDMILNWTGVDSLRKIVYLPSVFLTTIKAIFLIKKSSELRNLVGMIKNFWRADTFDRATCTRINKVFTLITRIWKIYVGFIIVFGIAIIPLPILDKEHKTLIFSNFAFCDMQNSLMCWLGNYLWQCILFLFHGVPAGIGFDLFFIICTGYIYAGCQLLKVGLEKLNTDDIVFRKYMMKKIIKQHDFIMKFICLLDKLCTMIMFLQFSLSLWSLVLVLYMLVANGMPPKFEDLSYFGSLFVIFTNQLFLYACGGTIIEAQIKNIAYLIFMVDWHQKGSTKLRQDLAFMILRAQNSKVLSAGKMSDLNLVLFIETMKNVLSVFTLIWQISSTSVPKDLL